MAGQTKKCIKCGNTIPQGEGKQTRKGVLCSQCAKKKTNGLIFGTIGGVVVAAAAAFAIYQNSKKVDSFEGVGRINDEVAIENVEVKTFDISKAIAVSAPTTAGGAIDNIVLFKSKVESAVSSLSGSDTQIAIPAVAVLFDLDSANLSSTGTELILEYAKVYCLTNKEAVISVDGYTCDLGTDEHNYILSTERANAVKQLLLVAGVPSDKVVIKGFGESMYGKLDVSGREANRRANISIKRN